MKRVLTLSTFVFLVNVLFIDAAISFGDDTGTLTPGMVTISAWKTVSHKVAIGHIPLSQQSSLTVTWTNALDTKLMLISSKTSCGCAVVKSGQANIAPGDVGELTMVLKPSSSEGPFQFTAELTFAASAEGDSQPRLLHQVLLVSGERRGLFSLEPRQAKAIVYEGGETKRLHVELKNYSGKPWKSVSVTSDGKVPGEVTIGQRYVSDQGIDTVDIDLLVDPEKVIGESAKPSFQVAARYVEEGLPEVRGEFHVSIEKRTRIRVHPAEISLLETAGGWQGTAHIIVSRTTPPVALDQISATARIGGQETPVRIEQIGSRLFRCTFQCDHEIPENDELSRLKVVVKELEFSREVPVN